MLAVDFKVIVSKEIALQRSLVREVEESIFV